MTERKVLLNPGPSTTTESVKMAQIVPDICPREKEFRDIMAPIRAELTEIVHGDPEDYTAVLFCGSGTICIDVALNSLLPDKKKAFVINNGSYSQRAVDVLSYYGLPYIELKQPFDKQPSLSEIEKVLKENGDIGYVYITHHETGSGLLNPVREVGELAHRYGAFLITDTTSSYAMIPINVYEDNIDFCMASAQKGLMAMTGLSFIIGRTKEIIKSAGYPKRSYYCNLYLQYDFFEKTGEMHFTPPVQTIYAAIQGLKESISCRIPAGTQPGTTLRLRGKGVKNVRTGKPGDIFVEVKLVVPTELTDAQKDMIRAFGDAPVVEQPSKGSKKKGDWTQKVKDFFD